MKKSFLFALLATAVVGTRAHAQTLTLISTTTNDGSFESAPAAAKTDFPPTASSTSVIPYWGSTAGTNDTGTQNDPGITQSGNIGAFEQPGTGIFNLVTSRSIVAGDVYTLTFYGRDSFNTSAVRTDTVSASLFSQAVPAGAAYAYAGTVLGTPTTFVLTNTNVAGGTAMFQQYTLTYTATAADAGRDVGLVITNTGGDYNGLDNFVLTVTPAAVPEPGACAMLGLGGLGAVLMARRRRA